jgi:O-antigen/teichoic acid export membrane protein
METMYAGYLDRQNLRFDIHIPAGDYDVQCVLMYFPTRMLLAALRMRIGRMAMLVMTIMPYAILAAAIGVIVAALAGAWWLTGGAVALLVAGALLRYRSHWRRDIEKRTRDVTRNFPHFVVHLRRVGGH